MHLSRIVTVYNQWEYLDWLSDDSLFGPDIEYLLIDDASPAGIPAPVAQILHERGIVCHRLPKNAGRSAARNAGAVLARAKFIEFVDGDDRPLPLRWDPAWADFDLVIFPAAVHGPEAGESPSADVKHFLLPDSGSPTGFRDPRPANSLWRKDFFENLGRFDPRMEPIEDFELVWRTRDCRCAYASAPKQSYNRHGSNRIKGMISTLAFLRFYQRLPDGLLDRDAAVDNEVRNLWLQATWHLLDRGHYGELFRKAGALIFNAARARIRRPRSRPK